MDDAKIGISNIDKIYIGNALYWQRQTQADHEELLYLQSSGTQYIDTGIHGQGDLKLEIKINASIQNAFIFGSRIGYNNGSYGALYKSNLGIESYYGSGTASSANIYSLNTDIAIMKDKNIQYVNGADSTSRSLETFNNGLHLYLFAMNSNGASLYPASMKLFYCKIWDSSSVLVRDFVPVQKDGVYCLYDKITQVYFYNQGTGEFIGA